MDSDKPKKRVLFAEASDLVQASHGAALEKLKCQVTQVTSATAAFEELSSDAPPFDLVLVGDLSKPFNDEEQESELSVIRQARKVHPEVPILIFTSHNYLDRAYASGATAHMLKPAGAIDLIAFVTPYLFSPGPREPRKSDTGSNHH
jgi:CheY-like chemotaxis protein